MDFVSSFNFLTEFGCGYVLLGCFSKLLNFLGMFLMFGFCFKVLRFGWYSKSLIRFQSDFGGIPRIRICLENGFCQVSDSKIESLEKGYDDPLKSSTQNADSPIQKTSSGVARERGNANSEEGLEGKGENEREVVDEDEVFDVMMLRKLVKIEREKANAACAELEEERTAASSSAEEAMAMILRLQREKSSAEIQANQFERMAEQRLDYDQEVIDSLQWTITQHESQKRFLEEQIGIYREQLTLYVSDDEINQLEFDVSKDDSVVSSDDEINQLEFDVSKDDSVVSSSETELQTLHHLKPFLFFSTRKTSTNIREFVSIRNVFILHRIKEGHLSCFQDVCSAPTNAECCGSVKGFAGRKKILAIKLRDLNPWMWGWKRKIH